jgi:glycosyltransferase involved in cell wall biosynthesis
MRILAVTPYYPPDGGGLERYAHEMLARLARRHEVTVLASGRAPSTTVHGGVRVHRHPPDLRLGNTPVDLGLRRRVARHVERERPDVVWAHSPVPFPAEMAYLASRRRAPFALTYHAGRLRGSGALLNLAAALDRATLERRMVAGSAGLAAVSPYVRDNALASQRGRVHVIPPGVDGARFTPAPPPPGKDVLFVGPLDRSYRWKGLDVLLRAFPAVRGRHPEARLVLVGAGDRVPELRARAARDGLVLLGRLPDADLPEAYRSCAVACLPSTTDAESFGMVLAEANACGRPVVASRVGGIPSFVRHGENGLLAPPGDAGALAQAINALLDDPGAARAMGARGRERVLRDHDWDRLALATERVLLQAAGL